MFLATFAFMRFFAEVVLPPPLQFAPIPKAQGKRSAAYQVRQALSDMTARNWHFQGKGRVLVGHLSVLNGLLVAYPRLLWGGAFKWMLQASLVVVVVSPFILNGRVCNPHTLSPHFGSWI